jgi:hypothetical protein
LGIAKDFLNNNCIERAGADYICKPIEDYNSTTYLIRSTSEGFVCNCQGCKRKIKNNEKPFCSHILAVYQFAFLEAQEEHLRVLEA